MSRFYRTTSNDIKPFQTTSNNIKQHCVLLGFATILALQMLILNSGRLQIRLNNMSICLSGFVIPKAQILGFEIRNKALTV